MRVLMLPHLRHFRSEESGIKRVIEAYFHYLPAAGVELVTEGQSYDLKVVHAGMVPDCDVAACHGLYWSADYPAIAWEWQVNSQVIQNLRVAKVITVPSEWVAETIRRDMKRQPFVVPHGIDWTLWQHNVPNQGYVLWNKNRVSDVCDPRPAAELARRFGSVQFVNTFAPPDPPHNMNEIGLIRHDQMQQIVQGANVYLSTVKETFGIGILEAMAAGVPVLGYGHGGIRDLVQHGVNGYLARPGDIDDLADGLNYCLKHRDQLGANGREMARAFTWEKVAEQVAGIYAQAAQKTEPTAAVIIPSFNYSGVVSRAVESAMAQTYPLLTDIVVVDDGSNDDGATGAVVAELTARDPRVRYVRQDNAGVANARNRGIAEVSTQYVTCLDADDALEPEFVARCVEALEKDAALGIAYTGLRYILPTGETGVSNWPGDWDFDKHLARQNQVPTCCTFRREMWQRLGGYRQRYAPLGAGSEDAEFWTRCGAYG